MDQKYWIAIDVGGSSLKSSLVGEDKVVLQPLSQLPVDSKGPAGVILDVFRNVVENQLSRIAPEQLLGVALGFPGPFDYVNGICLIKGVQKYEAIYGYNMQELIRSWLPGETAQVYFCNDADAAITGEARFGVGKDYRRLIGITLGTGIGAAFMVDGIPVKTGPGVPPEGEIYPILFNGEMADDVFSIRGLTGRLTTSNEAWTDLKTASRDAQQGDETAQKIFAGFGADLGHFLAPLVRDFQAEAVLALGGIANAFPLFAPAVAEQLIVPFLHGRLAGEAPLLGAVALAEEEWPAS